MSAHAGIGAYPGRAPRRCCAPASVDSRSRGAAAAAPARTCATHRRRSLHSGFYSDCNAQHALRRRRNACAGGRRLALRCAAVSAFDSLTRGFESAWATLNDVDDLSPRNMRAPLRELRRTLLEADVSVAATTALLKTVEAAAAGAPVTRGVTPREQLIKLVNDALTEALGGAGSGDVPLGGPPGTATPAVVLLAGLQGAGKTTAAAKLAVLLTSQGRKPFLVAADTFRPAAAEQLRILGKQAGVSVFPSDEDAKNGVLAGATPARVASAGVAAAIKAGADIVLMDTAGRVTVDEAVMRQLEDVVTACKPSETLLVVDAMSGQDAARTATAFSTRVKLTGCILTKLDGDARGGAALSVRHACGQPVRFVGTGEKIGDLEPFRPERVAGRILGMGDVVSLVENAQKAAAASGKTASQLESLGQRMLSAQFDLNDFLQQSEMMASLGSMGQVTRMLPGLGGRVTDAQIADAERRLRIFRSVIQSMTPQERQQPALVAGSPSRMSRIARGSGRTSDDVQNLLMTWAGMRDQMSGLAKRLGMLNPGSAPPTAEQIRQAGLQAASAAQNGRRGKEQAWREEQRAAKASSKPAAGAGGATAKGFGAARKGFGGAAAK